MKWSKRRYKIVKITTLKSPTKPKFILLALACALALGAHAADSKKEKEQK